MGEWPRIGLADLFEIRSGLSKKADQFGQGYPFLSFKDVFNNYFVPEQLKQLVMTSEKEQEAFSVRRGDVFLTRTSETVDELGMSCVALRDYPKATFNGFTKRLRPKKAEKLYPEFVGFYLRSPDFRQEILAFSNLMSTRASLNNEMISRLKIPLPPLPEQRAIAAVLSALDDKIALNRRMNETLEGLARALFKDWFVDFGPTRAKASGAKPDLPPEIWSLFPDRLDDNGVPEGWEEKCVRDILELSYGKSMPAKKRIAGEIPVYGSGGITGAHNEALVKKPTIIVGRKGTVGSLYWQPTPCFPIDTVFYVKTDKSLVFCYYLLQTLGLNTMNTDAAVPGLNRDNAYRLPVMWANKPVRDAFDSLVIPLRERIDANNRESRTLAQTRDLLLPKLMSGALRVGAAEEIVEGAL